MWNPIHENGCANGTITNKVLSLLHGRLCALKIIKLVAAAAAVAVVLLIQLLLETLLISLVNY